MKSIEEQANEYLKSLDEYDSLFDDRIDYEYTENQLIEFASRFAQKAVNAKLEEAQQKVEILNKEREISDYEQGFNFALDLAYQEIDSLKQ